MIKRRLSYDLAQEGHFFEEAMNLDIENKSLVQDAKLIDLEY